MLTQLRQLRVGLTVAKGCLGAVPSTFTRRHVRGLNTHTPLGRYESRQSGGLAFGKRQFGSFADDDVDEVDDDESGEEESEDDEEDHEEFSEDEDEMSEDEEFEEENLAELLKPKNIVAALDSHIVGQHEAKKAVAVALRNRWRRKHLDENIREEVMPKNILMIGPTGVGKTEIARRLAKMTHAPFVKVEATKYTEVGFHGRDVETIIPDLVEQALQLVRTQRRKKMKKKIDRAVEKRILDALVGKTNKRSRKDFRVHLRNGALEDSVVEIEVPTGKDAQPPGQMGGGQLTTELIITSISKFNNMGQKKAEKRKMKISDSRPLIEQMETDRLINTEDVTKDALAAVQQDGIVFLDEIDKICSVAHRHSADASAEGVQRDLLPLIEGSTVQTKYGNVQTDHILFICSGAFTSCKPSDLLAELQGRVPIRVNLKGLTEGDMFKILTEPQNNLLKQQTLLMGTENVEVEFSEESEKELARTAHEVNTFVENIGARRLHTVVESVMSDISYEAPEMEAGTKITITKQDVQDKLGPLMKKTDLTKFIL